MSKGKALFQCIVWSLFTIAAWVVTSWFQGNSACVGVALFPTTVALFYAIVAYRGFSRDARLAQGAMTMRYVGDISDDDPADSGDYGDYGAYGAAAPHTTPGSGWIGLPQSSPSSPSPKPPERA